MSRQPSDATQLRQARSEVRKLSSALKAMQGDRDHYRVRATKAEQESADWRKRFDQLLEVTRQPRNGING